MPCLGFMLSYFQPEAINLISNHWFQFGSLRFHVRSRQWPLWKRPRGFMSDLRSSLCFPVECRHAMFGFHA